MLPQMLGQMGFLREFSLAVRALVRPDAIVRIHVHFQFVLAPESLVAQFARKRTLVGVHAQMLGQVDVAIERLATHVADELRLDLEGIVHTRQM